MIIWRCILYIGAGMLTSFYFFPIGFTFLPESVNTKMVLAVVGAALFGFKWIREGRPEVSRNLLVPIAIAVAFSLICLVSADVNDTIDYSYATYFVSFFVWLSGAFTVCSAIRLIHREVDMRLLTLYLAAVCFAQCVAAMLIDNIPSFQHFVDRYVQQGQKFFTEVGRLYGIGAALDPAGVRFGLVLIMIAAVLSKDTRVRNSKISIFMLLIAFFAITVIGNIISRTTIFGVGCAVLYLITTSALFQAVAARYNPARLGLWFGGMLLVAVVISTYLYQTNNVFHEHLRFAFEGFFNWAEKGEWRTDSSDKLNGVMWIWPKDFQTWAIGSGHFGSFIYSTDIGYCRFILYCGLAGFSVFALLFVYLAFLFVNEYPRYWLLFMLLLVLSFLIWVKVATDIFQIYALFFCMDEMVNEPLELEKEYEDRLQYNGNL